MLRLAGLAFTVGPASTSNVGHHRSHGAMIDELIPQIEEIQADGAIVLL